MAGRLSGKTHPGTIRHTKHKECVSAMVSDIVDSSDTSPMQNPSALAIFPSRSATKFPIDLSRSIHEGQEVYGLSVEITDDGHSHAMMQSHEYLS